jgi:integrin alpha FG-GAP repeat containing protein 1
MALSLPYSLVGIGRSNNYIEYFTIKYPVINVDNEKEYSPIIPNSQLIIKTHQATSDE